MWKRLELEWKIVILAALLVIGLVWPVQRGLVSRLQTTLEQSVDPALEQLLRSQVDSSDEALNNRIRASLERNRQWQAMLPIIVREQQTTVIALSVVFFICLIIAAIWTLRRLTRPLRELDEAAAVIGQGRLAPIHKQSGGALGRLETSMDLMQTELAGLREKAQAEGMEQAWRDIARVMAHEIKNPLTPIRLTLDRINEKRETGETLRPEDLHRSLERIQAQVDNLERLVNAFRSFAREPEMHIKPVDLSPLLAGIAEDMKDSLDTDISGSASVAGDAHLLQQVVLNIWKNAVEAEAGRITVTVADNGIEAQIKITDDGPGIEPDKVEKVWIPYITYKKGGTGLGLPVVKRIIETMGGSVALHSVYDAPEHGITITITLPLADKG